MSAGWYVQSYGSQVIGPVTQEQLGEGIRDGRVPLASYVCPVGGTAWTPLVNQAEFAEAVRQVAPPPPPHGYGPGYPVPSARSEQASAHLPPEDALSVVIIMVVTAYLFLTAQPMIRVLSLLVAACSLFVYADARRNGIRKNPQSSSLLNMAPVGWLWVVFLFAAIGLPCYFASRGRLRTRQGGNALLALAVLLSIPLFLALLAFAATAMGAASVTSRSSSVSWLDTRGARTGPTQGGRYCVQLRSCCHEVAEGIAHTLPEDVLRTMPETATQYRHASGEFEQQCLAGTQPDSSSGGSSMPECGSGTECGCLMTLGELQKHGQCL